MKNLLLISLIWLTNTNAMAFNTKSVVNPVKAANATALGLMANGKPEISVNTTRKQSSVPKVQDLLGSAWFDGKQWSNLNTQSMGPQKQNVLKPKANSKDAPKVLSMQRNTVSGGGSPEDVYIDSLLDYMETTFNSDMRRIFNAARWDTQRPPSLARVFSTFYRTQDDIYDDMNLVNIELRDGYDEPCATGEDGPEPISTSHSFGAPICLNLRMVTKIIRDDKRAFRALIAHELSHHFEFDDEVAKSVQKYFVRMEKRLDPLGKYDDEGNNVLLGNMLKGAANWGVTPLMVRVGSLNRNSPVQIMAKRQTPIIEVDGWATRDNPEAYAHWKYSKANVRARLFISIADRHGNYLSAITDHVLEAEGEQAVIDLPWTYGQMLGKYVSIDVVYTFWKPIAGFPMGDFVPRSISELTLNYGLAANGQAIPNASKTRFIDFYDQENLSSFPGKNKVSEKIGLVGSRPFILHITE